MEFENLNYPSNLLEDKTIVISGAGSGIGRQIARTYAEFGADLILLSKSIEKLESIYEEINQLTTGNVIIQPINFKTADEKNYQKIVEAIKEEYFQIDGLFGPPGLLASNCRRRRGVCGDRLAKMHCSAKHVFEYIQ